MTATTVPGKSAQATGTCQGEGWQASMLPIPAGTSPSRQQWSSLHAGIDSTQQDKAQAEDTDCTPEQTGDRLFCAGQWVSMLMCNTCTP